MLSKLQGNMHMKYFDNIRQSKQKKSHKNFDNTRFVKCRMRNFMGEADLMH